MADSTASATAAMLSGGGGGGGGGDGPSKVPAPQATTSTASAVQAFSGSRFEIPYKMLVPALAEDRPVLERLLHAALDDCDAVFNPHNPGSELAAINALPCGVPYPLSDPMAEVLHWVGVFHGISGGRFDPTVKPLMACWETALAAQREPTAEEIEAVEDAVGWDKVAVHGGFLTKSHDNTRLDLGGIAKGWAVDAIIHNLQAHGYRHAYVDFGGDIRACGWHPDQREWSTAIAAPPALNAEFDPGVVLITVPLPECAMATSGDYLRRVGPNFCHIFDPLQQRPLVVAEKTIASASVQCRRCMVADAAATVLCILGQDDPARCNAWLAQLRAVPGVDLGNHFWFARGLVAADVRLPDDSVATPVAGGLLVHGPLPPPRPAPAADTISTHLRTVLRFVPHLVAVLTVVPLPAPAAGADPGPAGGAPLETSSSLASDASSQWARYGPQEPEALAEIVHSAHVALYSSVAPLFDGRGTVGDAFLFNVLRPSRMHSLLSANPNATCCIHFLHSADTRVVAQYASQAGGLRGTPASYCERHGTVSIDRLAGRAYHCHVTAVHDCGDHVLVLADLLEHGASALLQPCPAPSAAPAPPPEAPPGPSAPKAEPQGPPPPSSPLVYCLGKYYTLRPPTVDRDADYAAGDAHGAVLITRDGAAPVAGSHFTACSLVPPMVSFVVPALVNKTGCPVDGTVRVHLPQAALHSKVEEVCTSSTNPWLSVYAVPGHGSVDSKLTNGHLTCRVRSALPVPPSQPRRWVVVCDVVAVTPLAAKLPLICLRGEACSLDEAST
eukprot:EG_transcript_3121